MTVFRRLGGTADERAWLGALPDRVRRLEQMWRVQTGRPYEGGSSSWVAPGTTTDGTPVVLKVVWPHREARGESIGLRLWGGQGRRSCTRRNPASTPSSWSDVTRAFPCRKHR